MNHQEQASPTLYLGRPSLVGIFALAIFFVGSVGWALLAPVGGAAVATGTVVVDGNRKVIQHLEGGIAKEVLKQDGDLVEVGDALMVIDQTQAAARLKLVSNQLLNALAVKARLQAEVDGVDEIGTNALGDYGLADAEGVASALAIQFDALRSNRSVLNNETDIIGQQIAQIANVNSSLVEQIGSDRRQLSLNEEELSNVRNLLGKGYATKNRLRELKLNSERLDSSIRIREAEIGTNNMRLEELRMREVALRGEDRNRALTELQRVRSTVEDLAQQMRVARDILDRTIIKSPISGIIMGSTVHTNGSVVAPGAVLMEVVPNNVSLSLEGRLSPNDIDVVRTGLPARIWLTAFGRRNQAPLDAKVRSVSADALSDPLTGAPYYRVVLDLDGISTKLYDLYPGMTAEIVIATSERTAMQYFLLPIKESFRKSLIES